MAATYQYQRCHTFIFYQITLLWSVMRWGVKGLPEAFLHTHTRRPFRLVRLLPAKGAESSLER
jgi:hypothetical protein